jgi:2-iminobutanoate/2-iminopropanoate deaminase
MPVGHYSQGVVHNDLVFVSGQIAINLVTGEKVIDSIEAQTELPLRNVEAVLLAANSDLNHVLKRTIYISDMKQLERNQHSLHQSFGRALSGAGNNFHRRFPKWVVN